MKKLKCYNHGISDQLKGLSFSYLLDSVYKREDIMRRKGNLERI